MLPLAFILLSQMVFQFVPFGKCFSIENNDFFKIPPNAESVEEHRLEYSSSCTIWVRFRLPSSELNNFVATTLVKPPLLAKIYPQRIGGISNLQKETGWQLDSVTSFLAGEVSGTVKQPVDQFMFVDTSDPEEFKVYITTSEGMI
jgi:hypothetical protein